MRTLRRVAAEPQPDFAGKKPSLDDMEPEEPPAAQPGTSRSAFVIQQRLLIEPQYQSVLKLVEKYLPKFDLTNMTTAMHMCALAAKQNELRKRQIIVDPNFSVLFMAVKDIVVADPASLPPHLASSLLWSCAHLSIFDRDLFTQVISDATRRLDAYSSKGIATMTFAMGLVGHAPRASFMQALVRELRARIDVEFSPVSIGIILYAMVRLEIRDQRLMKIISDHLRSTGLEGWGVDEVVRLALGLSKMEYWDAPVFGMLGRHTLANVSRMENRHVMTACLAFSRASGELEEAGSVMDGLREVYRSRVHEFNPNQLATYAFALGKHKQLTTPLELQRRGKYVLTITGNMDAVAISDCLKFGPDLQDYSTKDLTLIAYSLMRLETRNEDTLKKIARQLQRRAAELTSVELVNVVYAFARLEWVDVQLIRAVVEEIRRRELIGEMDDVGIATLVYSLAVCHVSVPWINEAVAARTCESASSMTPQCIAMILWGLAVLNSQKHAEALSSVCLEDMATRLNEYAGTSVSCVIWATTLLTGTSSALWMMQSLFHQNFWLRDFESTGYAMVYSTYAALAAEDGLDMSQVYGWEQCRGIYEELTERISAQNSRLSERLRMQSVPHLANQMPPALEGFPEAGVRADIVLENLKLIIEVEGPRRMTIPLDRLIEVIGDAPMYGRAEDVVADARAKLECDLTGSAAFKRRILRKCGWKVVTIAFDENEEYVAEALQTMSAKAVDPPPEGEETAEVTPSTDDDTEASAAAPLAEEAGFLDPAVVGAPGSIDASFMMPDQLDLSEYEQRLRLQSKEALLELERRIVEERGNAASAAEYVDHVDYRKHQLSLEREVFREMVLDAL